MASGGGIDAPDQCSVWIAHWLWLDFTYANDEGFSCSIQLVYW